MKTRILYVERQPSLFVSIERVFRLVADHLNAELFDTSFQQVPFANDLFSVIKNLLFYRPDSADVYHITGHIHYMALVLPKDRTVLTIHDLRFLFERTGIRRYILKKLLLDWPLRRLKYVTAISEATRLEILANVPNAAPNIRVIENPIGPDYFADSSTEFDSIKPLVLQVGTMENKNVPRLIHALAGIPCRLRIIGPLDDKINVALKLAGIEYEQVDQVDDQGILEAYRTADIVAFCSTYEGFGLPIIEAQAMRKPVLTSNISPMSEVAGVGAELVDPYDPASIRAGIERIIADHKHRERIVELGIKNAKRFDATVLAEEYAALYSEMLVERQ